MNNMLKVFENPEFGQVRTVSIDGEPWFVGKDVAIALGYERPTDAARKNVYDEDRGVAKIETPYGTQNMVIINESGLYALIFSSRLDKAQKFKHWVTSEVIPSIRKTGSYSVQKPESREVTLARMALLANEVIQELKAENEIMKPKAEYYDRLVDANLLTNLRDTAKELKIPERIFIKFLINHKFIYRNRNGNIRPSATYIKKDYFAPKEVGEDGKAYYQTFITPKGKTAIIKLVNKCEFEINDMMRNSF